ncbi:MAG: hypothetical protein LBK62_05500 [Treponema sp.]|jgi:hypothetical protein|nr:hypothetical protein [Treponema sp.]
MENAGRVLDGSAFAEKTVAVYRTAKTAGAAGSMEIRELRNKSGERSVGITLDQFPVMKLRGSAPDGAGGFYLKSLEYLGGSLSGWNEYTLDLYGTGSLELGESSAALTIPQAPEALQISRGRIHRYDTRLIGEEALTSLRNRRERIVSLAAWMRGREDAPAGLSRKDFEKYWKPILLPEMVGDKKRPAEWRRESGPWVRAEDIRWNTGYTERVFPEELRAVRDSGTMLRDWEEALGWIYLEYEWERIIGLLSHEHILRRIK